MDQMILETQKWMNTTYAGRTGWYSIPENGRTGWTTVYALLRAFQIENCSTTPVNNIGPWTIGKLTTVGILEKKPNATPSNNVKVLQGLLWCKGYEADGVTGIFGDQTEAGLFKLQRDIGIEADAKTTLLLWYSLFSMDQYVLLPDGDESIRQFQQNFNRKHLLYYGFYIPCDGLAGRQLYTCFTLTLQMEEGYTSDEANGVFGDGTLSKCPNLVKLSEHLFPETIKCVKIALNLNVGGFKKLSVNSILDADTFNAAHTFDEFLCLPSSIGDSISKGTIIALFTSNGDSSRSASACDMATPVNEHIANALISNGYKAVGRYLTYGIINGVKKQLTKAEVKLLKNKGLNFMPIYQTTGDDSSYFSYTQGITDARKAIDLAYNVGVISNTIIYFAVDCDVQGGDIPGTIIPYFQAVDSILSKSIYRVGIYGTRNICGEVAKAGYSESSYLSDMSTGYSGNLGYVAPSNWSFDQYNETVLSVDNGTVCKLVPIDKVTYRYHKAGKGDKGVSGLPDNENDAKLQYAYKILDSLNLFPAALNADFNLVNSPKIVLCPWLTVQFELKAKSSISNSEGTLKINFNSDGSIKEAKEIATALTGFSGLASNQRKYMEDFFSNASLSASNKKLEANISLSGLNPTKLKCVLSFESDALEYSVGNSTAKTFTIFEVTFEYTSYNNLVLINNGSLVDFARFVGYVGVAVLAGVGLIFYGPEILVGAAAAPSLIDGALGVAQFALQEFGWAI